MLYGFSASGPVELPLFRIQGTDTSDDKFVDNIGRSYADVADWKRMGRCLLVASYLSDSLVLEDQGTDSTVDQALRVGDSVALVGGIIAGGMLIVGGGSPARQLWSERRQPGGRRAGTSGSSTARRTVSRC